MKWRPEWREPWLAWGAGAALVRLGVALLVPILPEEAYHWCYARHPALGYYDHPPMIAWMIGLGRLVAGDTVIGIRLVPSLASIVTAGSVGWMSRQLHGASAARWTVILLSLQPLSLVGFGFGFPDAPLVLFWALAAAFVVQALRSGAGAWWLAAGGALGAALLSKYTACFLGASVFLYLLVSPRDRRWLKTPWPYLGMLVAVAVFSPVFYWNATHDWASFRFQSVDRLKDAQTPHLRGALAFLGGQWGTVVPLTLPLAVAATVVAARRKSPEDVFLLCLSLPMLLFFFVVGWTRATHVLWPFPAWLALTVLMGDALARGPGLVAAGYRARWMWVLGISVAALAVASVHLVRPVPGVKPLRELTDWDEIAAEARRLRTSLPSDSFYVGVGRRYSCAAQLAYHLNAPELVHAKNLLGEDGLGFAYWDRPDRLLGKDAVVVSESDWSPNLEACLGRSFRHVERAPGRGRYAFFIARDYAPP